MIGILDTNADPDELQYPIPGNDDAIRSVGLLTRIIADAAAEGLIQRHQKTESEGNVSAVEPLAEWERELLEASETPSSEAEKIEAVDGEIDGTVAESAAAVAEVVAAEVPVEENDADAVVAEHEAAADATVVPHHAPESDEATEARIEAEATEAETKPVKAAKAAAKARKAAAKARRQEGPGRQGQGRRRRRVDLPPNHTS